MSFDRFFKVALLVVLSALVVVYALNTPSQVYAQKRGTIGGSKTGTIRPQAGIGTYDVVVSGNRFHAMDTRTGQLYQLNTAMDLRARKVITRWVRLHGAIR